MILTGGNIGGAEVDWVPDGSLEDGRKYMIIDGYIYTEFDEYTSVFFGLEIK